MMDVAIIVLNWNGYKDTIDCLKSIEKLVIGKNNVKTFVVDNASTDDSVKEIEKFIKQSKNISLIVSKKNLGFAGGNNLGIKQAMKENAQYIFVLNNDTLLDSKLIQELLKVARAHPDAGLVSPKIYFAKGYEYHKKYSKSDLGKVIWFAGGKIDWQNVYASNYGVDEVDHGQFDEISNIQFATGAALLIKAKALSKVGLFDEQLFMYFEDVDLSMRMRKKGWEIVFAPKAVLWHKVSQSSGIGSQLSDYFTTRNRMVFGMKYAPLRSKIALIRESLRLFKNGRKWQRVGLMDYYIGNLNKGSWK